MLFCSVGSLGKYNNEKEVHGILVTNCTIKNTTNGVRIKTWSASPPGVASRITFQDIILDAVKNPIIIDQTYGSKKKKEVSNTPFNNDHDHTDIHNLSRYLLNVWSSFIVVHVWHAAIESEGQWCLFQEHSRHVGDRCRGFVELQLSCPLWGHQIGTDWIGLCWRSFEAAILWKCMFECQNNGYRKTDPSSLCLIFFL